MKKFFLLLTLALAFIACENQLGQTPETDMIHLWPASDSTGLYGYINESRHNSIMHMGFRAERLKFGLIISDMPLLTGRERYFILFL